MLCFVFLFFSLSILSFYYTVLERSVAAATCSIVPIVLILIAPMATKTPKTPYFEWNDTRYVPLLSAHTHIYCHSLTLVRRTPDAMYSLNIENASYRMLGHIVIVLWLHRLGHPFTLFHCTDFSGSLSYLLSLANVLSTCEHQPSFIVVHINQNNICCVLSIRFSSIPCALAFPVLDGMQVSSDGALRY